MSSAAVQHSSVPSQYDGTPARDRYAANPAVHLSSSPPASRRAGSASASYSHTPQQPAYDVDGPGAGSPSLSTPRGAAHSHPASPADPLAAAGAAYAPFYPDHAGSSGAAATSPPAGYDGARYTTTTNTATTRGQSRGSGYGSETERAGASDGERRRQQQQQQQRSPRDEKTPGSGSRSQRSGRHAPAASRSATAVGQTPIHTSLPREDSAIINHIVVDDPRSDLERERARTYEAHSHGTGASGGGARPGAAPDAERASAPPTRSRQEHLRQSTHRRELKFGEYILGQTLGEGEFGKVKMGWKKDSSVQVAIKLIRKESLAGNATRLPKIYREISILRELEHPNIVRLHEFVETERHMGIILEYASGGELFDYILNQRYLADGKARKLFAQLISGVGYLHKKGIVHRDLKLENLLLDRNKNIIITDFGFANTFNPHDELGDDVERRITDKDFVKRERLDVVGADGARRGDLMQTSCGSPCYAAPELVVSDGLYTGRKVDVWSCGVILYAMLAGYLPFDDDPANPEGDNINLLYKYIVSTPLTFPEYVTPHARDLLRRILVPDPRRRADLFEVARHSWLSDYMHVVGFIGSSTKNDKDIARSALRQDDEPLLGRSASVREPGTRSPAAVPPGAVQPPPIVAADEAAEAKNKQRDAKRRTVQLEYVPPQAATARSNAGPGATPTSISVGRTRPRGDAGGPVDVGSPAQAAGRDVSSPGAMRPPSRPVRDQPWASSDAAAYTGQPPTATSRPNTGGTLGGGARLPSRGNSYSQPALATPTTENVQGRFSQPKPSAGYIISSPMASEPNVDAGRPMSQQNLAQFQPYQAQPTPPARSHKRSSTLGSIGDRLLGRNSSKRSSRGSEAATPAQSEKRDRRYPPLSMKNAAPAHNGEGTPRQSTESRRRPSFSSFIRKNSDAPSSSGGERRGSRRFSLLSGGFGIGGRRRDDAASEAEDAMTRQDSLQRGGRPPSKGVLLAKGQSRSPSQSTTNSTRPGYYEPDRDVSRVQRSGAPQIPPLQSQGRYDKTSPAEPPYAGQRMGPPPSIPRKPYRSDGYGGGTGGSTFVDPAAQHQDPVERYYTPSEIAEPRPRPDQYNATQALPPQQQGYDPEEDYADDGYGADSAASLGGAQNIRPNHRKFGDAYDQGYGGSSNGARRVMDFFRRRGKDRTDL